jgi:hypothetical protein
MCRFLVVLQKLLAMRGTCPNIADDHATWGLDGFDFSSTPIKFHPSFTESPKDGGR